MTTFKFEIRSTIITIISCIYILHTSSHFTRPNRPYTISYPYISALPTLLIAFLFSTLFLVPSNVLTFCYLSHFLHLHLLHTLHLPYAIPFTLTKPPVSLSRILSLSHFLHPLAFPSSSAIPSTQCITPHSLRLLHALPLLIHLPHTILILILRDSYKEGPFISTDNHFNIYLKMFIYAVKRE